MAECLAEKMFQRLKKVKEKDLLKEGGVNLDSEERKEEPVPETKLRYPESCIAIFSQPEVCAIEPRDDTENDVSNRAVINTINDWQIKSAGIILLEDGMIEGQRTNCHTKHPKYRVITNLYYPPEDHGVQYSCD